MNRYNRYQPPCAMPAPMCEQRQPLAMAAPEQACSFDTMPLAVPFVQWQTWGNISDPDTALRHGTIFADLDLPFCGSGVRQG